MPARFTAAAFLMLCTVTFGAVPTVNDVGSIRADTLKAKVTGFRLSLSYVGESGKPYYSLLLSVPELSLKKISTFSLQARISKDQALKVIDHLTKVGSLDRAHKTGELEKLPQPSYLLSVRAGDLYLSEILGWDLDMLKRLDGLRSVLDGDAVKSMDTLLGRLYGHRREWMAAVPDKRSAEDAITVTGLRALDKGGVSVEPGLRAVGRPAQVQARVLDGSGHNQKIGDMEIWISQAVAKKGSPLAKPYTDWIALDGNDQRLYTSKQGGFIIDGKTIKRTGKYEVEIDGCEGIPFNKKVTLKPGERRIVNLTDNPAPNNVFIALEAPVSE